MQVDELVGIYIELRDFKDKLKRKHSGELSPVNEKMNEIENRLQQHLIEQGVDSMKTANGTAFLQNSNSATVKDWDVTLDYIKKNDEWSFLEARVNKTAVKDYIASTGEVPPGVEFTTTQVTRVRR